MDFPWHNETRLNPTKGFAARGLYTAVGFSVDCLHTILYLLGVVRSAYHGERHFSTSDVDEMSDAEIIKRVDDDSLKTLSEECGMELYDGGICRITKDTVVKMDRRALNGASTEALTLDMVARHTSIPVPRVRRVLPMSPDLEELAIIMDYIPGRQLVHVWPTMSLWAKLRVAFILRGYVRQLRAIRHPRSHVPGPIAPGDKAYRIMCPMMMGQMSVPRPPCPTYADLSAWFNRRYALSVKEIPQLHVGLPPEPFDDSQPLVLTHCDLNMRNILIGDDGKVYLLDWALSGFYPPWFEYVNWRYWLWQGFSGKAAEVDRTDYLWNLLIPIITHGPFFRQERWYLRILPVLRYVDRPSVPT